MTPEQALEIAKANEWEGDVRVNFTTAIKACRVLAQALAAAQTDVNRLKEAAQAVIDWGPEPLIGVHREVTKRRYRQDYDALKILLGEFNDT